MDYSTYRKIKSGSIIEVSRLFDDTKLVLILNNNKCLVHINGKLRFMKYKFDYELENSFWIKGVTKKDRKSCVFCRTTWYRIVSIIKCL